MTSRSIRNLILASNGEFRLVWGDGHLDRDVSRTFFAEAIDPTPWLSGDELVMAADSLLRSAEDAEEFVRRIDSRAVAALLVIRAGGMVRYESELVGACASRGLPLLSASSFSALITATKALSRLKVEGAAPEPDESQHELRLIAAMSGGLGVLGLMDVIEQALPEATAMLFARNGRRIVGEGSTADAALLNEARGIVAEFSTSGLNDQQFYATGRGHWTVLPIPSDASSDEFLVVVSGDELRAAQMRLLSLAAICVRSIRSSQLSLRQRDRSRLSAALQLMRSGQTSQQQVGETLAGLGFSVDDGFAVLSVRGTDDSQTLPELVDEVERAVPRSEIAAVAALDRAVVAFLPDDDQVVATIIARLRVPGAARRTGVSYPRLGVQGIRSAVDEALAVSRLMKSLGRHQLHHAGFDGVLEMVKNHRSVQSVAAAVLTPLERHDSENGGVLGETLRSYFTAGPSAATVAAALHVHRHTLTYRLNQIESLTGLDPRAAGDAALLQIAMAARSGLPR